MNSGEKQFITVVSGLPRSGTSMMMQMLVAGGIQALADGVRTADEDNLRGYYELEAIKRSKTDASWVKGADGKVVKAVYALLVDLPAGHDYRVVFMRRNLEEVLDSQQAMLARSGKQGTDLPPAKMADVFRRQLAKVDAWLKEQPNFSVLDVEHHEVVSNSASAAARINQFLGGGLDEAAMAAAVDPALYRQRRN